MKRKSGFYLYLTQKQAESLARVCNSVGGSPAGRRGDIDKIAAKLRVRHIDDSEGSMTGGVYFETDHTAFSYSHSRYHGGR